MNERYNPYTWKDYLLGTFMMGLFGLTFLLACLRCILAWPLAILYIVILLTACGGDDSATTPTYVSAKTQLSADQSSPYQKQCIDDNSIKIPQLVSECETHETQTYCERAAQTLPTQLQNAWSKVLSNVNANYASCMAQNPGGAMNSFCYAQAQQGFNQQIPLQCDPVVIGPL